VCSSDLTQQQNSGSLYNALTSGSKIIGTVITDSDMRIDGTVEGDVKCAGKLVVGEQGLVKGTVECQNAEIMGRLDGKIDVKYTLALRATSTIKGEINTGTLMIEPNAIFNGSCTMGAKAPEQPAKGK
jgi:cytoskeletal protein CcmA (bactofilin family)